MSMQMTAFQANLSFEMTGLPEKLSFILTDLRHNPINAKEQTDTFTLQMNGLEIASRMSLYSQLRNHNETWMHSRLENILDRRERRSR